MDIFFFAVKNRGRVDKYSKKEFLFMKGSVHLDTKDITHIKGWIKPVFVYNYTMSGSVKSSLIFLFVDFVQIPELAI